MKILTRCVVRYELGDGTVIVSVSDNDPETTDGPHVEIGDGKQTIRLKPDVAFLLAALMQSAAIQAGYDPRGCVELPHRDIKPDNVTEEP